MRWLGSAGFKISISDPTQPDITRNIYIDPWLKGNPQVPEDLNNTIPDDADVIIISHGHFDHS